MMPRAWIGQLTPFEATVTALAFFILGLVLGYRNRDASNLRLLVQWIFATTMLRYAVSYWTFHDFLREGYAVIVWAALGLLGVMLARPKARK